MKTRPNRVATRKSHAANRRWPMVAMLGAVLAARVPEVAVADDVRLAPAERWSTVFAGDDVRIRMTIRADRPPEGTLRWSHTANQRTLNRGEVEVRRGGDGLAEADFVLRSPPLREGVIFATTVSTQFVPRGGDQAVASSERTLWLFPRDPMAGQTEWARDLDIQLFDPEGTTATVFDTLNMPYQRIHNVAAIDNPERQGVLIVGEGTSLRRYASLAETALRIASSGRAVVLLSPVAGSLPIPGIDANDRRKGPLPGELRFARQHVIAEFDKRLDHLAWAGTDNTVPSRGLLIKSRRGRVEATVSEDPQAWPWAEIRFPNNNGVLVICGFQIIEHWDNGPTPRYLLIRLLESLSAPDPSAPTTTP